MRRRTRVDPRPQAITEVISMLRITARDNGVLIFRSEGDWRRVRELGKRRSLLKTGQADRMRDLTGVTSSTPRAGPGWRRCTSKGPSSLLVTA
jgi:hypothetical protein